MNKNLDGRLPIHLPNKKALRVIISEMRYQNVVSHPAPSFDIYISHLIVRQNFQALTWLHSFHRLKNECDKFAATGFSGIKLAVCDHKLQYTPQLAQA